jgi:aromatic ring-opening dioxygenase LigB subunit
MIYNYSDDVVSRTLNEFAFSNNSINSMTRQKVIEQDIIDFAKFIKNREAELAGIDKAIKEMQDRKKDINSLIEKVENLIKEEIENGEQKEFSCPYFNIKLKKNPPKVEVDTLKTIPEEYLRTKTITEINKQKIKDEIKNGVLLDFAKLVQETRVEIK